MVSIWDFNDPEWIHEQVGNNPLAWLAWVDTLTEAAKRIRPHGQPRARLPIWNRVSGCVPLPPLGAGKSGLPGPRLTGSALGA